MWEWATVGVCVCTLLLLLLLELPAIIPLVLDHTPQRGRQSGERQERRVRVARYSHHKKERSCCCCHCCCCCWLFFLWGCCPTLLPLLFFVDTFSRFARLDALSCVAVCQSVPAPFTVLSTSPASLIAPIRPQAAVPGESPVAAPQCCLFFFRCVSGARRRSKGSERGSPVRWALASSELVVFARKSKHTSRRAAHICMEFLKYVPRKGGQTATAVTAGVTPLFIPTSSSPHPLSVLFLCFSLSLILSLALRGLACATDAAVATTGNFGVVSTTLCTFIVYIANTAALASWQPIRPLSRRPVRMFGGMAWPARAEPAQGSVCSSLARLGVWAGPFFWCE